MQLDHQKLKSLSQAILELYRPMPTAELPRHFLSTLNGIISSEQIAFNDFNPRTGEIAITWAKEVPSALTKLLPVFEKHVLENPLVPKLFRRDPVLPASRISDAAPLQEYRKTTIYNEFYRKIGADFQLACGLSTRKSPYLALAMNREGQDFTDDEVFILEVLRLHMQQALDISNALESSTQTISSLMSAIQRDGRGIVCFDGEYRVLFATSMAEECAEALFHCRPQPGHLLPCALRDCVEKLRQPGLLSNLKPRDPLVFSREDGSSVCLKLAFDPERCNHSLIFERESYLFEPRQLKPLGLSLRETDVTFWVLRNKTNWEIGQILHISSRTVEKHVERIFSKLGVNNRQHLVSKARELCD